MKSYPESEPITFSWEEYLQMEAEDDIRYEYHDGRIVSMAGASNRHNEIATNCAVLLKSIARKNGCKPYAMEVKLFRHQSKKYLYPDGMLTCHPLDLQTKNGVRSPILIIEVLSDSTRDSDRSFKLREYLKLPSLKHYLLIEQTECEVQHYRKRDDQSWEFLVYDEMDMSMELTEFGSSLPLSEMYEGVEFGPEVDQAQEEEITYQAAVEGKYE